MTDLPALRERIDAALTHTPGHVLDCPACTVDLEALLTEARAALDEVDALRKWKHDALLLDEAGLPLDGLQ